MRQLESGALALLALAIAIDLVGLISFFAPLFGETFDLVWAPISALLVYLLFRRPSFAGIALVEEILPGMDFVPTATIAWLFWMLDGAEQTLSQLVQQRSKAEIQRQ